MALFHLLCGFIDGKRGGMLVAEETPIPPKKFLMTSWSHFCRSILRYRELHSYRKTAIGNMDQTMCRYNFNNA